MVNGTDIFVNNKTRPENQCDNSNQIFRLSTV